MTTERASATGRHQFSLAAFMRLVTLLAIVFAVARSSGDFVVSSLIGGAIVGLFVAEYFGTTPRREFLCLVVIPDVGFVLGWAGLAASHSDGLDAIGEPGAVLVLLLALFALLVGGVIPSVVAVMAVIIVTAIIDKLTRVRLLKYEWSPRRDSDKPEAEKGEGGF